MIDHSSAVRALVDPDEGGERAIPLRCVGVEGFDRWRGTCGDGVRKWLETTGFRPDDGAATLVPGDEAGAAEALVVVGDPQPGREADPWVLAGLPFSLPPLTFRLVDESGQPGLPGRLALAWALGAYRFDRFKSQADRAPARLIWPEGADRAEVACLARATHWIRDLVNLPAGDLTPAVLADEAAALAGEFGAAIDVVSGGDLLARNFPLVHAVGRASTNEPRLIDIRWGEPDAPKVLVVGKGVCFDSGGYDLKPSSGMLNMKKDMGGAAHALGLSLLIMTSRLPVRLRLLIPAVENLVAGNAFKPMDILKSRKGLTVEIGNTDAEGRLILADALAAGMEDEPAFAVDFATLTGAARVALGPDLPAMFCNDDGVAATLAAEGARVGDPLWRMPLWQPYGRLLRSPVADLSNVGEGSLGGAVTAALFLERFVAKGVPWAYRSVCVNSGDRPGRPKGGEAMGCGGLRAVAPAIWARSSQMRVPATAAVLPPKNRRGTQPAIATDGDRDQRTRQPRLACRAVQRSPSGAWR
ncbi:MAG: leucyl aminopeptidase family protein [Rhodospirillaceae bacterium]|nr:leucyl aminopeptidase family protein [Rhodospirillaceae bacterium]